MRVEVCPLGNISERIFILNVKDINEFERKEGLEIQCFYTKIMNFDGGTYLYLLEIKCYKCKRFLFEMNRWDISRDGAESYNCSDCEIIEQNPIYFGKARE